MPAPVAAVILAAGESSRMGSPKALLPFRQSTFLEHLAGLLASEPFSPVLLVLGHDAERIRGAVRLPPAIRTLVNPNYRLGQLSSLQTAIRALEGSDVSGLLVAPVDHPAIGREVVEALLETFTTELPEVVVPTFHGRRGHPVIFSARLFPELLEAPVEVGARAVVRRHTVREVATNDDGVLADIDDPDTYQHLLAQGRL